MAGGSNNVKWSLLVPLIVSGIYCAAVFVIAGFERSEPSSGFIGLRGMGTFLATFPASMLFEKLSRFDVESNLQVAVSMLLNGALLFAIIFGVLKIFHVK